MGVFRVEGEQVPLPAHAGEEALEMPEVRADTETEHFVETLRPAINGLLDGLDPHAARIPPTAWQRANRS